MADTIAAADPPQQGDRQVLPERISDFLENLRIFMDYGRHLAARLERRAAGRGFATIAQFFGAASVSIILSVKVPPIASCQIGSILWP
ncbi:MAG TPA: hypothetical protein VMU81_08915 [Acetobacteraceae bacterium]|jgi:hypothetical protein|nr:hypothetical protein [Acetobacteraceae bacterium]